MTFTPNQLVRARYGVFTVLALRSIEGEPHAQLKEVNPVTGRPMPGMICLPCRSLVALEPRQ